jgi:hypothetical protein
VAVEVVHPSPEAHPYQEAHPCLVAVPCLVEHSFLVEVHPYPVEAPYLEGIDLDQTCLCSPATCTNTNNTSKKSEKVIDRARLRSYSIYTLTVALL